MNKSELIVSFAEHTGESKAQAKRTVEAFSTIVAEALLAGQEVTLPGVGKLKVKVRNQRNGRNPKTGESIVISRKNVTKFSPTSRFAAALNSQD